MADRIEEIRARVDAATPGPWGTSRDLNGMYTIKHGTRISREDGFGSDGDVAVLAGDEQAAYSNGSFIARAREDVPYLLDCVAALEARLHEAAMARVWTNEDGKKFVFADDIKGPLLGRYSKADA